MINKTTSIVVATYIQAQEDIQIIYLRRVKVVGRKGVDLESRISSLTDTPFG